MLNRFGIGLLWGLGFFAATVAPISSTPFADEKPRAENAASADAIFGLTTIHDYHLELTPEAWSRMQDVTGGMPFPGAPPAPRKPPEKPGEEPADTHRSVGGFGMEFPWTHARLVEGDKTYANVGLRYKGNGSYIIAASALKRNFKIDLDHYDEALRYHDLKTINLNAGAMDPTKIREALAYAVFRRAGIPAPRTAFARVTLTVPGKYDREYLGLYTVVEQIDKNFLARSFSSNRGLLVKPERIRGLEYLGDDWSAYRDRYNPKREPTEKEARRLMAFVRLIHVADDKQFREQIGSFLDVDGFLKFLGITAMLSSMDSFLVIGHNFYVYLDPQTNRHVFMPWDQDLTFAGFPMLGSPDQQMDLSLSHPHAGENKLIDRLLAVPEINERYQKILRELVAEAFAPEQLLRDIETVEQATREARDAESKAVAARKENRAPGFGPPGGGMMFGGGIDLRSFVDKRHKSIAAQFAGKSKGFIPAGFGPPGGPGGPPGGMGNPFAKPLLTVLDADKDGKLNKKEWLAGVERFFKDSVGEGKETLEERTLADGINRLLPSPPGFGPPPGQNAPNPPAGGPGRPPAFGPGNFFAPVIIKRADADKDGKLTQKELVAAAEGLFAEADKDKRDTLDEKALGTAFGILFPPPPGFGPPGANRPPSAP